MHAVFRRSRLGADGAILSALHSANAEASHSASLIIGGQFRGKTHGSTVQLWISGEVLWREVVVWLMRSTALCFRRTPILVGERRGAGF